jgi:hypothetical protein
MATTYWYVPTTTVVSPSGAVITSVGSIWAKTISSTYGCVESQVPAAYICLFVSFQVQVVVACVYRGLPRR